MKKIWTNRWKKALIWFSGYFSLIAFAIVGGYVIVKSEDDDLRYTAKNAFFVVLIFAAIDAFISVLSSINSLSGYNATFANILSWVRFIVLIAETTVYVVFILLSLFGGDRTQQQEVRNSETPTESQKTDNNTDKD